MSILAGLCSLPALALSVQSIRMSQEQQAYDRAEKTKEQQAADYEKRAAFARNVTANGGLPGDPLDTTYRIRNANRATVQVWITYAVGGKQRVQAVRIAPCSEGLYSLRTQASIPEDRLLDLSGGPYLVNAADDRKLWEVGEAPSDAHPSDLDDSQWGGYTHTLRKTSRVSPCRS
ncbi:hypothetical protein Ssi03_10230 [Sphaerisporangium siamense]|nr:hypothetical protein Ssi03_10230 [Sphaerisporangium siamense]